MISAKARIAGVIGWPISHSRSPRLHGWWLERYGIDGAYVPLAVPPERVELAIRALPDLGFRGVNVTVPHKRAALSAVDRIDAVAERIGAVNTIVVGEDGILEGRNTDAEGFIANLREGAPDWQPSHGPVVVIGAGGAGRAVVAALVDAGVREVRLVNRSIVKAEALAADIGGPVHVFPWFGRLAALADAALLVNTTSLGMNGQPMLDLDLGKLPPSAVVADLVYSPLETHLLAAARGRGNIVVDGLGMLLHQAVPGFEAWFGVRPEVTAELRAFVLG
ncbi:MAG: shikimate dehydrogenase [Rhodospirillaceae bacterium]